MDANTAESRHCETAIVHMVGAGLAARGGISSLETLILEHQPENVEIRHIRTYGAHGAAANLFIFFTAFFKLLTVLGLNRTDLVHLHFAERGSTLRKLVLAALVMLFRKPFILHCHGAAYREFYEEAPEILKKLIRAVFGRCTRFVALSTNWLDFYKEAFRLREEQTAVLPNPIVIPPTVPGRTGRSTVTFVFMGHIGCRSGPLDHLGPLSYKAKQDKGAFDLIRAFAALQEPERATAALVLAGSGETEHAREMARNLEVNRKITVHEWLNPEQRDELLDQADVFVLPSYHEGLPMALLEAMARGLPPITTPVGGIPELVTHQENGLLVAPGNLAELTSAMQKLISDSSLRAQLGDAARQSVLPFNIRAYMTQLVELYRQAICRHKVQS